MFRTNEAAANGMSDSHKRTTKRKAGIAKLSAWLHGSPSSSIGSDLQGQGQAKEARIMTAVLDRRTLMSGAVTAVVAPSLAVGLLSSAVQPAASAAPTSTDPAIIALKEYELAHKRSRRAWRRLDEAEDAARPLHGRRPWSLIRWHNYDIGRGEMDRTRRALEQSGSFTAEELEASYQQALRQFPVQKRKQAEWDRVTGCDKRRREMEVARSDRNRAIQRLVRTNPTTTAGAYGMLRLFQKDSEGGECEWHQPLARRALKALRRMAGEV